MTGFFQSIITIVLFILILGVLVIIHELGHFFTARAFKVRVLEFGIGFPPRAKVLASGGETVYTLNWLPIGGFVKLEGEDGTDPDDPRSFSHQGLPKKLTILIAGVVMNVAPGLRHLHRHRLARLAAASASASSRSSRTRRRPTAGLQPGEAIVAIDGEHYQFITGPNAITGLRDRAGETITLTIADADGTQRDVSVTLRTQAEIDAEKGALGISGVDKPFEGYFFGQYVSNDLPTAIQIGVDQTVRWMGLIVGGLASLVDLGRQQPDRRPAGLRARSASPPRSATSSGTAGRSCCSTSPGSCRPTWPWSTSCRSRRSTADGC